MATIGDDSDDFNRNSPFWQKHGEQCIVNLFAKLGIEQEEFLNSKNDKAQFTIFSKYEDCHYQVPELQCQEKSVDEAEQYKSVGNTYFAKGQYEEALGLYKQSILFAPKSSETLAVSYANRSAVFIKLKKYALALQDIDAALKAGYPEDKMEKLLQRRELCDKAISKLVCTQTALAEGEGNTKVAELDFKESYVQPTLSSSNPEFENLSAKVVVEKSEKAGRYLMACQDIKPGEIILAEKPFAMVQIPDLYRITCHHCSTLIERAVPCDHCSRIAFCSESCNDLANYHKFECKLLDVLFESGLGKDAYLALRLATRESPDLFLSEVRSNRRYQSVLEAESHPEFRDPTEEARIAITAKFLTECLRQVGYLKNGNDPEIAPYLMRFLRSIRFNKLMVDRFLSDDPEEDIYDVAVGMFNTLNLINHSCDPNVFNYFVNDQVVLVAKRPIRALEEVAFCYGPRFPSVELAERQKILQEDFRFLCECSACSKQPDVKIIPNLNMKMFTQQRLFRCPSCDKISIRMKMGASESKCQECKSVVDVKPILQQCTEAVQKFEHLITRVGEIIEYSDIPVLESVISDFYNLVGSPSEYGLKAEEILMYVVRRLASSTGLVESNEDVE